MDAKSLSTLELPKVLERLASYAAFSASKELARSLEPTTDLAEARRRQAETTEATRLLSVNASLSIGGAHDVRLQATQASRGAVLEPQELLDIKSTLVAARTLARFFEKGASGAPTLGAIAGGLQPTPGVIDAISQTLDERGEVLDSASPALQSIRADLRLAHERLNTKLQRLITDPKLTPMLQEPIITQRDGRYVIPLRAEFKGRLRAIIHDQSASGATLFIEPLTVVDLNNQVRELVLAERDEVRRILAAVSTLVGQHLTAIVETVEALARLDLAFAKAGYAEVMHASEPLLRERKPTRPDHPGSVLRLHHARHPLLDPARVVPINLELDPDTFVLVITGPNTGGKTVSLKTAGLLALMAQCGLHLPAESGSELTIFDAVYADIGDEQSIEQSLSTFSSHITTIIRVLAQADESSLVVLDELGAGTDPQEGSALARAILGTLIERKITTLVATHYSELKAYAHTTPGVRNASMEFDLETLRPTYHLTIGLPGRSNALAIAQRLGLDVELIERARTLVAPEDVQAEQLLDEIHRQRDAARAARHAAELAGENLREQRQELAVRLEGLEEERRQVLQAARDQAQVEVQALHDEIEALRRRLAVAAQPLQAVEEIAEALDDLEERTEAPVERVVPAPPPRAPRTYRLGQRVLLPALQATGVVMEIGLQQAEVQIGRLRVRARLEELALPEEQGGAEAEHAARRAVPERAPRSIVAPEPPPFELDLRGRMVDEALEELDRRLDAACYAGLPFVRIIHGKGTGRLRQAIREALRLNAYAASFQAGSDAEGGDGVTVVHLKQA
jgi:DNA mismatch repair protein MutS2